MQPRIFALLFLVASLPYLPAGANDWKAEFVTPFESSDGWETAEYAEAIRFYERLAADSPRVQMLEMGATDSGEPLHLVLISDDPALNANKILSDPRTVLLINNGIHPGESDGVDASMALARDLAFDTERFDAVLQRVIVAIIPVYNIGGALNRNSGTRANQNGPRAYGFRGNARNYDLNRDFVKCDTRNARSFAEIFHRLDPDLFIDTHVSNGADYQHVMTTSHSQKDKLGFGLGGYLDSTFEPQLFARMEEAGFPTIPYVNTGRLPPENGFDQFLETPRYSTGFTALFQTMGFMTETHMLKPYPQRVEATYQFLVDALELLKTQGDRIQTLRRQDRQSYPQQQEVAVAWEVDRSRVTRLLFRGYESSRIKSEVTPGTRLFYDRESPFVQRIPYYNHYRVSHRVTLPAGYLIPGQWHSIIELMRLNQVEMQVVETPMKLDVEVYRIGEVKSRSEPYEGHYFHDEVEVTSEREILEVRPGDVIVPIRQDHARYVVETLEPAAMDSLFRWNRFDTVLQQKEHFSPYVFEDSAAEMLERDSDLRAEFEKRKRDDPEFAEDRRSQLEFLYRRSPHYERSHRRYPIARLIELPGEPGA